jgi:hypothetical protein
MHSSVKRYLIAAAAALIAGNGQAASFYITPSSIAPSVLPTIVNLSLYLDLENVLSQGGGVELTFSGVLTNSAFLPSAQFDSLNTIPDGPDADSDPDDSPYTGYGPPVNQASTADLEIYIGAEAGITGLILLGNILAPQMSGAPGAVSVVPSSSFGGFITMGGQPIENFTYNGVTVGAVPLPATAWLAATGFGLAGFWRRRRG